MMTLFWYYDSKDTIEIFDISKTDWHGAVVKLLLT